MREQGFHSVIEFVSAMPHIVRTERPYDKGDWLLSDATQPREGSDGAFYPCKLLFFLLVFFFLGGGYTYSPLT